MGASLYIKSSLATHPVPINHVSMLNKGNSALMLARILVVCEGTGICMAYKVTANSSSRCMINVAQKVSTWRQWQRLIPLIREQQNIGMNIVSDSIEIEVHIYTPQAILFNNCL